MNIAKEILLNFIINLRKNNESIKYIEFKRDNVDDSKAMLLVFLSNGVYRFYIKMRNKERMFVLTDIDSITNKILEMDIKNICVEQL